MNIELNRLNKAVEDSIPEIKKTSAKSFCISTVIPKKEIILEEKKWDGKPDEESIKGRTNREIAGKIIEKTKMDYDVNNADIRITYNLRNYTYSISNEPMFIFGRYMKHSRMLSQSRWMCRHCGGKGCTRCSGRGKMYESIEEIIGEAVRKQTGCGDYSLHASGREDVDVENYAGRPFIMEITNPKKRDIKFKEMEDLGETRLKSLRNVNRGWVELVANSHFNKSYLAEVELEAEADEESIKRLEELKGREVLQFTPKRVAHRRALIERKRKILGIKITGIGKKTFECEIRTEPGTYIKELINGDEGRTKPNFSEILGINAVCRKLTVVGIEDEFLDTVK
ncbi:tRNA pseudouridine(54/55) synthase Pus10 [Candidatus Micrarchaeota archaeon]|nr:tRNA pseudouridine(54/55) synthase Pus10 [Candidatus Micrarchaeota archaeon]